MTKAYLGIDTSNYTTSAAFLSGNEATNSKKLLPVKEGALGLRQSEAVFHHVKQLPQVLAHLDYRTASAIGVSVRPRNTEGSYMPCFLVGQGTAYIISQSLSIPVYEFSHQQGHIAAAAFSANRMDLFEKPFLAFHLSGGTSDCLYVNPGENRIPEISLEASSLDLKAGQAVDRVGLMLGYSFPAGRYVDEKALESVVKHKIKPAVKGADFCLSGIENHCRKMYEDNIPYCDICSYCLSYLAECILSSYSELSKKWGELPLLMSGGVSSSAFIRQYFTGRIDAIFAKPEFSADNASGVAVLAAMTEGEI